jgi:ubiquinone/menaquinone biosynthesis C-methylase UbiE
VGVDIANYGNTDIVVENFYHLPFAGGSVDTVSIIASLNYFENPLRVLQDVHRVLKDDGQLLITMPQGWAMKIWHRFRERHARRYGFSEEEIKDLLCKSGFALKQKKPFMFFLNYIYMAVKA